MPRLLGYIHSEDTTSPGRLVSSKSGVYHSCPGRCSISLRDSFVAPLAVISGRRKVYYGWYLLAGSVVAMALGSGVSFWALTLYIEPLEQEFGWSRAAVTGAFSVSIGASGIVGPFLGRWIDARGPRSAIVWGSIATALSYVLMATTSTLWQWYLYSAINAVFRQMMFFIPFQALISRFFDQKRGIALGILGTGFSMGGLFIVPVMNEVIAQVQWQGSFVFSAIVVVVVFVPVGVFLVKDSPASVGQHVDGLTPIEDENSGPAVLTGVPLSVAMRTPLFWVLAAAVMLFFYGLFGWLIHQVPFYESIGISRTTAGVLVAIAAGSGIATRLAFGFLSDSFRSMELAALGLAALMLGGMTTLLISSAPAAIAIFIIFYIFGAGGAPMMEALLLTRAFGVAFFATIFGVFIVFETVGQTVSPVLAGFIYDSTGSYDLVLAMWVGTFAGSIVLFAIASRLPRPEFLRVPVR